MSNLSWDYRFIKDLRENKISLFNVRYPTPRMKEHIDRIWEDVLDKRIYYKRILKDKNITFIF